MKYIDLITESASLLVIDVQPAHSQFISFDISKFTDYLNSYKGTINYIFNGPDLGYEDENELVEWLVENGLDYDMVDTINFIPKSYGWIRDPMDQGFDESDISNVLAYMMKKKIQDSMDLEADELDDIINDQNFIDSILANNTVFGLPDIYDEMKRIPKSVLVGGGKGECLLEMEITMDAMNIKYKRNNKFIY